MHACGPLKGSKMENSPTQGVVTLCSLASVDTPVPDCVKLCSNLHRYN